MESQRTRLKPSASQPEPCTAGVAEGHGSGGGGPQKLGRAGEGQGAEQLGGTAGVRSPVQPEK